jgi:hypothetical protein
MASKSPPEQKTCADPVNTSTVTCGDCSHAVSTARSSSTIWPLMALLASGLCIRAVQTASCHSTCSVW